MPIEAYKLQWRFTNTEWSNTNEKEIPLVLTSSSVDSINIEINSLLSETEYIFRAASVNKLGVGVWSAKEVTVNEVGGISIESFIIRTLTNFFNEIFMFL